MLDARIERALQARQILEQVCRGLASQGADVRDVPGGAPLPLHARGEAEWVDGCARLLEDRAERERMGRNGRRLVEGEYSIDVVAPVVAQALREAAGEVDGPGRGLRRA